MPTPEEVPVEFGVFGASIAPPGSWAVSTRLKVVKPPLIGNGLTGSPSDKFVETARSRQDDNQDAMIVRARIAGIAPRPARLSGAVAAPSPTGEGGAALLVETSRQEAHCLTSVSLISA